MGLGGTVAMSLITGCYIDLIYRANTSSCGPEQLKDGPQMERGPSGEVVWEQLEQQRLIVTALPKKKNNKKKTSSHPDSNFSPDSLMTLMRRLQGWKGHSKHRFKRTESVCDPAPPVTQALELNFQPGQFSKPSYSFAKCQSHFKHVWWRDSERGEEGKKTRQLAKLVQLQTEWGDSLYA